MNRLLILLLVTCLNISALGQASPDQSRESSPLEALQALSIAVQVKSDEVEALRMKVQTAATSVEKDTLAENLQKELKELDGLQTKFAESASGVDISLFVEVEKEPFSWQNELGKILEPIIDEVETATARSRKMAGLRKDIQQFGERRQLAETALKRIHDHLARATDPVLKEALQSELLNWEQRQLLASNQERASLVQLEALESEDPGGFGGAAPYIRGFLSHRGLNLLYGIGSAMLVFISLRLMLVVVRKLRKGDDRDSLGNRIFILLTNLLSIVGAVVALLIVFSAAGDLFLLGLVLIFLIGAAWAGIQVIPQFIESLKIILNIGMVKEHQRIVFDGIPWNVESLGFSCRLVNAELDDGLQVLPVKRLVGLHSRPWCADETPFPICRGEWVSLSDGNFGRSVSQNPGTVTIEAPGGARITYSTPDFLQLAPRNLSRQSFRVRTRFRIDHQHKAIATSEVIDLFKTQLEQGLPEIVNPDSIRSISVQFAHAGDSSLDYEIEADLNGSEAHQQKKIEFALQRLLVDACNRHHLCIPFTQVTLHQAQVKG